MKRQIFISYRREGGESLAALLYERFTRMGYRVFYDVESLRSGDFNEKLLDVIAECEDMLLVLPPNGLDRCIGNPQDWVRREIAHAVKLQKNIIPVMMRNFVFPENLPEDISAIERMNGVSANMEYFDAVVHKISEQLLLSKVEYTTDSDYVDEVKRKIKEGSPVAKNELAFIFEQGRYSVNQNLEQARRLYEEAFSDGCLQAGYNLADIYERCAEDLTLIHDYHLDIGEETDPEYLKKTLWDQAYQYYEKTAIAELAPAQYKLGNICEKRGELEAALNAYREAAQKDYPPALNALGWMYQNGKGGVEEDPEKAKIYYQRAMDLKFPAAFYNYATLIEGDDTEEAVRLLKKVAYGEETIPLAIYVLGQIYENTYHDLRNAIVCYEQALSQGIREAGVSLERCRNTTWHLKGTANEPEREEKDPVEEKDRV